MELFSLILNEFLPGDDQPVLHVAAGKADFLRLLLSQEQRPELGVVP